jgi:hypothetical protein
MGSATDLEALDDASGAVTEARKSWEAILKAKWVNEAFGTQKTEMQQPQEQRGIPSNARTTLEGEWTRDVKNVLRACIATSIAVSSLGNKLRQTPRSTRSLNDLKIRIPEPGEKDWYHDWWLIPVITEKR